jgi:hypothetical protein
LWIEKPIEFQSLKFIGFFFAAKRGGAKPRICLTEAKRLPVLPGASAGGATFVIEKALYLCRNGTQLNFQIMLLISSGEFGAKKTVLTKRARK